MSKKYREIMDQVQMTDEMKQRILRNVQAEMENTEKIQSPQSGKIIRSKFFSYGKTSRYLSAAACIMMLIVGGLTVPKLINRGNTMNPAVGIPGATSAEDQEGPMVGASAPRDDTQESGEQQAMIANGMVEVDSLQKLSKELGFEVPEVKNIPFEVENTVYVNGWNEFAQVTYQGENQEVMFRKAKGTEDVSGDFNEYPDVKEIAVNMAEVTLKGENGIYSLAIWQQDGFAYSLSCEPGVSEAVFAEMIQSIPQRN